jgi:hypothetical protein
VRREIVVSFNRPFKTVQFSWWVLLYEGSWLRIILEAKRLWHGDLELLCWSLHLIWLRSMQIHFTQRFFVPDTRFLELSVENLLLWWVICLSGLLLNHVFKFLGVNFDLKLVRTLRYLLERLVHVQRFSFSEGPVSRQDFLLGRLLRQWVLLLLGYLDLFDQTQSYLITKLLISQLLSILLHCRQSQAADG